MICNKKEQERSELHRAIWNVANDLRGSVDGWDFKQYILGMLFYRYISEKITTYINADEHAAGDKSFDYAKLDDSLAEEAREDIVRTLGFFMLPSELFNSVREKAAAKSKKQIDKTEPVDDNEGNAFENLNVNLEKIYKNMNHLHKARKVKPLSMAFLMILT